MGNRIMIQLDDESSEEGRTMFANISDYRKLARGLSVIEIEVQEEMHPAEQTTKFLRDELRKMIKNSEAVIKDCDEIIRRYKTKEEYITSDAKVAKTLHQNLITRLTKILEYIPAFDHNIDIDSEEPNKLFFDNTKRD